MTEERSTRGSRRTTHQARLLAAALALVFPSLAKAELVTALPHGFAVGAARGYAVARGVEPSGSRHARELPGVETARVAWQRRVAGGISANLLVDAEGRIFAVGAGRVTQLGADGSLQFSELGAFSGAVAAALLTDGSRAVLTREGHVIGWAATGGVVFDRALEAPPPQSSSGLLPLPDGGALASVGEWLFEIDATRSVRSYTSLPASIQHTLFGRGRALLVDEQGRVFEWDRREPARQIGGFSGPLAAALLDEGAVLGLTSRGSVERLDREGELRELARLDPPRAAPVLAAMGPGRTVVMRSDGSWFALQAGAPAPGLGQRAMPEPPRQIDMLADSRGTLLWWAADLPLHLETASGVGRELADTECSQPVSLVPAGRSRVVAACGSGTIWLVGPAAAPEREDP